MQVNAEVIDYPARLLQEAQDLLNQRKYGLVIVVAHMAVEVRVQRSLAAGFRRRHIQELEDPVTDLLNGYNLANERIRALYTALTGDNIQTQPFWTRFKASAARRNAVIHDGTIPTESEARESLVATAALVAHMKSNAME